MPGYLIKFGIDSWLYFYNCCVLGIKGFETFLVFFYFYVLSSVLLKFLNEGTSKNYDISFYSLSSKLF